MSGLAPFYPGSNPFVFRPFKPPGPALPRESESGPGETEAAPAGAAVGAATEAPAPLHRANSLGASTRVRERPFKPHLPSQALAGAAAPVAATGWAAAPLRSVAEVPWDEDMFEGGGAGAGLDIRNLHAFPRLGREDEFGHGFGQRIFEHPALVLQETYGSGEAECPPCTAPAAYGPASELLGFFLPPRSAPLFGADGVVPAAAQGAAAALRGGGASRELKA